MIQTIILIAVLAAAALYIGRRAWRTARSAIKPDADAGCASGCGCSAPPAPAARPSIEKPAAR